MPPFFFFFFFWSRPIRKLPSSINSQWHRRQWLTRFAAALINSFVLQIKNRRCLLFSCCSLRIRRERVEIKWRHDYCRLVYLFSPLVYSIWRSTFSLLSSSSLFNICYCTICKDGLFVKGGFRDDIFALGTGDLRTHARTYEMYKANFCLLFRHDDDDVSACLLLPIGVINATSSYSCHY